MRYDNCLSLPFHVRAGVRQGGVLSPVLFSVFMNSLILKLRKAGLGAYLGCVYVGCLLYADDIMLIFHSASVMQRMLDVCSEESLCWDFVFNSRKSVAFRIGSRFDRSCAFLYLCGAPLAYVDKVKYLGVVVVGSRCFKCSFDHVKSKFYCVLNTLLHRVHGAPELVSVQLFKSFCVPVIMYALEAVFPNKSSVYMLDNLVNRELYLEFLGAAACLTFCLLETCLV